MKQGIGALCCTTFAQHSDKYPGGTRAILYLKTFFQRLFASLSTRDHIGKKSMIRVSIETQTNFINFNFLLHSKFHYASFRTLGSCMYWDSAMTRNKQKSS